MDRACRLKKIENPLALLEPIALAHEFSCSLPTSDELQVKIESPENFMKMRFALAGSCRREDIPACGRGRGTGLLGRSDKP